MAGDKSSRTPLPSSRITASGGDDALAVPLPTPGGADVGNTIEEDSATHQQSTPTSSRKRDHGNMANASAPTKDQTGDEPVQPNKYQKILPKEPGYGDDHTAPQEQRALRLPSQKPESSIREENSSGQASHEFPRSANRQTEDAFKRHRALQDPDETFRVQEEEEESRRSCSKRWCSGISPGFCADCAAQDFYSMLRQLRHAQNQDLEATHSSTYESRD